MVTYSGSNDRNFCSPHHHLFRWLIPACLASALSISNSAYAEWVEWIADADIQIRSIENLNRSGFSENEEDDSSLRVEGSVGRAYQVDGNLRYTLSANLEAESFDDFDELDTQSLGMTATVRRKLGTGLTVPWIKGLFSPSYLDVEDDIRSGLNMLTDLQVGTRFSERADLAGGLRYKLREGKDAPSASPPIGGTVFDQEAWEVYVSSSYLLSPRWLGSFGIAYMDGEIDSACNGGNVAIVVANEKLKGIVKDNVFGGCVYRLEVDAMTYALDLSYALGHHHSVNFGYQLQSAKTDFQSYKNTIISLSYKYSY